MKVGIDSFSLHPLKLNPMETLEWAADHDFEGVQFGHLGQERAVWREVRQEADRRGLYSYVSVTSPNRHLKDKSAEEVIETLTREIEWAADCHWHELHVSMGDQNTRYNHDLPWLSQLADTIGLVNQLAPVLRDYGSRLNFEPHGEVTTFELVRLVEQTDAEIAGVCLDTANVLCSAEDPVAAAGRVAPYTHLTHAKDAIVYLFDKGIQRQGRAPGGGCLDWPEILRILGEFSPDLPLSIEDHKWLFSADIFQREWHALNPDLPCEELAMVVETAWLTSQQIAAGDIMDPAVYEELPYADEMEKRLFAGRDYLKQVAATVKTAQPPPEGSAQL